MFGLDRPSTEWSASNLLALVLSIQLYLGGQGRLLPVFTTAYYQHVRQTWHGTKAALSFVPLSAEQLNTVLAVMMLVTCPVVAWYETRRLGALMTIGLTAIGWYTLKYQGANYRVPQINMALSVAMLLCS